MQNIIASLLMLSLNALPASASPDTLAVSMEIDEPDASAKVQVGVHIAGPHGCASVTDKAEPVTYDIRVCRDDDNPNDRDAVLAFDIERVVIKEHGTEARHFKMKSRVAFGKKITVARWAAGGDKAMEIRVEIH